MSGPELKPAEAPRTRVGVGWALIGVAVLAAVGTVSVLAWLLAG